MLHVSDPRAAKQFTRGFFTLDPSDRWTRREFAAILKPPPKAQRRGAVLRLRFGVPEKSITQLHSIELSALVNGTPLPPEKYTRAGMFDYVRDVPAAAFPDGNATVDFLLDKVLPASGSERRDLGVIVDTIGFEAK